MNIEAEWIHKHLRRLQNTFFPSVYNSYNLSQVWFISINIQNISNKRTSLQHISKNLKLYSILNLEFDWSIFLKILKIRDEILKQAIGSRRLSQGIINNNHVQLILIEVRLNVTRLSVALFFYVLQFLVPEVFFTQNIAPIFNYKNLIVSIENWDLWNSNRWKENQRFFNPD